MKWMTDPLQMEMDGGKQLTEDCRRRSSAMFIDRSALPPPRRPQVNIPATFYYRIFSSSPLLSLSPLFFSSLISLRSPRDIPASRIFASSSPPSSLSLLSSVLLRRSLIYVRSPRDPKSTYQPGCFVCVGALNLSSGGQVAEPHPAETLFAVLDVACVSMQ